MSDERLLTDAEASEMLRMLPVRLSRLVKAGQIPYVLLPDGEPRFLESDLWSWVCERRCPPEPTAKGETTR